MAIKVADAKALQIKAVAKYKSFVKMGLDPDEAMKAANEYLTDNEFTNELGHNLKMSLCQSDIDDGSGADDTVDDKNIESLIHKAVGDALGKLDFPTKGKGAGSFQITEQKDDWERLVEDGKYGFKNMAEFGSALYRNNHPAAHAKRLDHRLGLMTKAHGIIQERKDAQEAHPELYTKATPTSYASELVGADGGFLVPPDFRTEIWVAVTDSSQFLNKIDLTPTNSNIVNQPFDVNTPWDNTSGIQVFWRQQGQTMNQSKPAFQFRQVQLNELFALVPATDEELADAPRLNNYLSIKAPMKMSYAIDDSIFAGNGAGAPQGFLTSPSAITIATASTGSNFALADLAAMYPHLLTDNPDKPSGCWVVTQRAFGYLITLGTSSNAGFPLAMRQHTVEGSIINTILGLPVYVSQHAKGFGQKGDISLVNFKGYIGYNKQDSFDFQSSIHLYFDSGATAFRFRWRFGGQPALAQTIQSANDTGNTMSHFVTMPSR